MHPFITHCVLPAYRGSPGPALVPRCNLHALHGERHHVLKCSAMQGVRVRYPALFSPAKITMQLS